MSYTVPPGAAAPAPLPRPQGEPIEDDAVFGVGVLAPDVDVDLADPIPLPLDHPVDQVEFTRLLEKAGVSLDVGKDKAAAVGS